MIRPSFRRICRLGSSAGTGFYAGVHRGQRDSLLTIARSMRDHGDKESAAIYSALARSAHRAYLKSMDETLAAVDRDYARLQRLMLLRSEVSDLESMPDGARRTRCRDCGWTFGTHAPDCARAVPV